MAVHQLKRTQLIPADVEAIWQFFSSPTNLGVITPPYMNFRITSPPEEKGIYEGQIITYKVSPILSVPLFWMTEIREVEYLKKFVDIQKKGPYKLWHHEHTFVQQGEYVLMTDTVHYELPFGILGDAVHGLFVKKQLEEIFDYRNKKIIEIYG
jgi:ligand-binding SRPBCC domain-containing protein